MRRAVARPCAARTTAKGNRFSIRIAAIGKTTIAASEFDQREMPWNDLDTPKRHPFEGLEYGPPAEKFQRPEIIGTPRSVSRLPQRFVRQNRRHLRPHRPSKAHSPRPSERRIAGIGCAESRIEGVRSVPVRQSGGDELLQRLAMRGRPACCFHSVASRSLTPPAPLASITIYRICRQAIFLKNGIDFIMKFGMY